MTCSASDRSGRRSRSRLSNGAQCAGIAGRSSSARLGTLRLGLALLGLGAAAFGLACGDAFSSGATDPAEGGSTTTSATGGAGATTSSGGATGGGDGATGGGGGGDGGGHAPVPERIAKLTVETAATSIAAGGGYLFWTSEDGGHLRKVAAAGGPPEMFVDGQAQPLGIAVNATTVFWAAEGSQQVSQASIADPGSTQLTTMTVGSPLAVAVRGQQLAWSEYGEPDNGAVMSSNNMQMTTVLAQGTGLVRHLAVGTPAVFWITADGATLVQSLPAQPGFESLATEIGLGDDMANAGLAAGEAAVFWTVPTGGEPPHRNSVYRFTLGGDTAPDAIATAQSDPRGIALSGATVVWANCGTGQTDGTIMQKDANNPVVELAAGLDCPDRVAIGDDNVYWMANNGTEIWKLPL